MKIKSLMLILLISNIFNCTSQNLNKREKSKNIRGQVKISNIFIKFETLSFNIINKEFFDENTDFVTHILAEYQIGKKYFTLVETYYAGEEPNVYTVNGKIEMNQNFEELIPCSSKFYMANKIEIINNEIIAHTAIMKGEYLGMYEITGYNIEKEILFGNKYKKISKQQK